MTKVTLLRPKTSAAVRTKKRMVVQNSPPVRKVKNS